MELETAGFRTVGVLCVYTYAKIILLCPNSRKIALEIASVLGDNLATISNSVYLSVNNCALSPSSSSFHYLPASVIVSTESDLLLGFRQRTMPLTGIFR